MMYAEFVTCYETTGQAEWLKKFVSGLRVVDNIEKHLRYTVTMSQQYSTPITIRRVMLPSTSTLSIML
jgi:hypothetical protein